MSSVLIDAHHCPPAHNAQYYPPLTKHMRPWVRGKNGTVCGARRGEGGAERGRGLLPITRCHASGSGYPWHMILCRSADLANMEISWYDLLKCWWRKIISNHSSSVNYMVICSSTNIFFSRVIFIVPMQIKCYFYHNLDLCLFLPQNAGQWHSLAECCLHLPVSPNTTKTQSRSRHNGTAASASHGMAAPQAWQGSPLWNKANTHNVTSSSSGSSGIRER